jgi:uncharacterized membrane protein
VLLLRCDHQLLLRAAHCPHQQQLQLQLLLRCVLALLSLLQAPCLMLLQALRLLLLAAPGGPG